MPEKEIWEKLIGEENKKIEYNKKIFEEPGAMNVNGKKRCRILKKLVNDMKTTKLLPFCECHKEKHGNWSKK